MTSPTVPHFNGNLHPRQPGSLYCEHGEHWGRVRDYGKNFVKLCREHGCWALCDRHAVSVKAEHDSACNLGMTYTIEEYRELAEQRIRELGQ